jgi:hypothetical protein
VKLIDRIEMMTKNEVLSFKNNAAPGTDVTGNNPGATPKPEKPTLIIVDEVDGALESENQVL